mgnify:CR=1 FL=1
MQLGWGDIEGVSDVNFENSRDYYRSASALYEITFEGEIDDKISLDAMKEIKETLSRYDVYIASELGSSFAEILNKEMRLVTLISVLIIVSVLLFTSKTYMEIPVMLMTFGTAAILNVGTNFILGEISFVSDSIAIILQLALAIDYAIILCHRYTEERESLEAREAVIAALSKAIPEISSSSLTTISGLLALMLMQFRIGFDMGLVLIKAIILSLASVFFLMPGLLLVFSKWIDRTGHKNFVPHIQKWGKFVIKTKYILPPIFILLLGFGFYFSRVSDYVYGYSKLTTIKQNEYQIAEQMIEDSFGKTNLMAILVPTGDYEKEGQLIKELESLEITDSVIGLANVKAGEDYIITDPLTPRQFAEMADLDIEAANLLYSAYAISNESYGQVINGLEGYTVPLIDMFFFMNKEKFSGIVNLDDELKEELDDLYIKLNDAKLQLKGDNYSRILINTNLPEEGEETFKALEDIHKIAGKYYNNDVHLVGESTNNLDLNNFFTRDNKVIGVTSAIFVMIVLLFTFQSAGLPVLLMMVIQGSISINFAIPYLTGVNVFFISYLIVSSIQMGANIDYAIIITGRFQDLKKEMPLEEAIVEALDQAFPTVLTSGSILASAGLLIGFLSSEPTISSIGLFLGKGTIISMILVMCILPQILLLGNKIIERTGFNLNVLPERENYQGHMELSGHVKGHISGTIDAKVDGTIIGDIDAIVESQSIKHKEEADRDER